MRGFPCYDVLKRVWLPDRRDAARQSRRRRETPTWQIAHWLVRELSWREVWMRTACQNGANNGTIRSRPICPKRWSLAAPKRKKALESERPRAWLNGSGLTLRSPRRRTQRPDCLGLIRKTVSRPVSSNDEKRSHAERFLAVPCRRCHRHLPKYRGSSGHTSLSWQRIQQGHSMNADHEFVGKPIAMGA